MAFSLRRGKKQDDVIVDRVTGAFNRRQLDAVVAAGFDLSDQPTGTLIVVVDQFDAHGSKKGNASNDQVLERVSWTIMATVRTSDIVYRHDTSSFCALLPATSDVDAVSVAERVRSNVEKMPLLAESKITVSVGVATGVSTDIASTIERACEALSAGASSGSNKVFSGGSTVPEVATPVATQPVVTPAISEELASAFGQSDAEAPSMAMSAMDNLVDHPPASVPLTPPSL